MNDKYKNIQKKKTNMIHFTILLEYKQYIGKILHIYFLLYSIVENCTVKTNKEYTMNI